VSKWRYSPKIEDGQPVVREGMSTIIRFEFDDGEMPDQPADAAANQPDSRGCYYAGELFGPGAVKLSGKAGDDNVVVDDPDGIAMTCVEDTTIDGGFRWVVATQ